MAPLVVDWKKTKPLQHSRLGFHEAYGLRRTSGFRRKYGLRRPSRTPFFRVFSTLDVHIATMAFAMSDYIGLVNLGGHSFARGFWGCFGAFSFG